MNKKNFLYLAFISIFNFHLLSYATVPLPPGYCYKKCQGLEPKTPYDFRAKADSFGDPNSGGKLKDKIKVPKNEDGSKTEQVPTKDFFDQLNEFENWSANECGENLNDPNETIEVAGPCYFDRLKEVWRVNIINAHSKTGTPPPNQEVVDAFFNLAISPEQKKAKEESVWFRRGGDKTAFKKCWPKDIGAGSEETFGVFLKGELCVDFYAPPLPDGVSAMKGIPRDSRSTIVADGKASAYILKKELKVTTANVKFNSPHGSYVERSASVYFLGMKAIDESSSGTDVKWSTTIDLPPVKQGISATFAIGPVPITIEAGASGKAGVRLMARLTDMWANGKLSPFVDLAAYASGYVNAFIAQGGVTSSMTLLQDNMDLYGFAGVAVGQAAGKTQFIFTSQIAGENKITALNGRADAFVRVRVPKFIGWKWKNYNVNLFNWEGVSSSGYLFSYMLLNQPIATFTNNVE